VTVARGSDAVLTETSPRLSELNFAATFLGIFGSALYDVPFSVTRRARTNGRASKAANESIHTFPSGPLLKTAHAAEAIADNLRMLARPEREAWLEQSVRDWYDVMGRELRKLGILKQ
jgi:hypothetical protein